MADNISKEKQLYREYTAKVDELLENQEAKEIFDSLASGKNSYMRIDRIESSSYDTSWIEMIEQCIPDLGTIINNPRLNTKTVEDLVPVELARKTNADSVKHLASHTQFIKEITEEGDVIPNKVLNIGADDEIKTYENRFIATLIKHLVVFVEKRYEFIQRFAVLHNHEILYFKNQSKVNGSEVNVETKITVVSPKNDPVSLKNNEYVKRIQQMRQFILYFYNSKFMKAFKNDRDVRNPILQTNIIRKNPLYHHCYELYRFLEAYDRLGVSYKVDESYSQFNAVELHELNTLMFANYLSLQGKDKSSSAKEKTKVYKPKIITSSDDEAFVYGPLLKGPIEFVRVDEAYQRYLDSKLSKDIPSQPNKYEKQYYSQEIDVRKINRRDYEEKLKLLERKKWQKIQFDKDVLATIRQREEEEERLRQARIEARLKEEEEYLRVFRQKIVDEAMRFKCDKDVEEDFDNFTPSVTPSAFSVQRKDFDFAKMTPLEKELALQKLRLAHLETDDSAHSVSSLDKERKIEEQIYNSKKTTPMSAAKEVPSVNKKEDMPVVKVLPVAPTTSFDLLTAGLEDEQENYEFHEIPAPTLPLDEEKDNKPSSENENEVRRIKPIPVPVKVEEEDFDNRLTSFEKKAVLVYDLNVLPQGSVKPLAKKEPDVPFYLNDEDYLDPFERIRVLNKAYKQYDEANGPFYVYPGLYQDCLTKGLLEEEQEELMDGFILHSKEGYYTDDGFSSDKKKAIVYSDYDEANRIALLNHCQIWKVKE